MLTAICWEVHVFPVPGVPVMRIFGPSDPPISRMDDLEKVWSSFVPLASCLTISYWLSNHGTVISITPSMVRTKWVISLYSF